MLLATSYKLKDFCTQHSNTGSQRLHKVLGIARPPCKTMENADQANQDLLSYLNQGCWQDPRFAKGSYTAWLDVHKGMQDL